MRSAIAIIVVSSLFFACSKYNIKSELKDRSKLADFKRSGIIIRVPDYSSLDNELHNETLSFWLNGYRKINELKLIDNASESLSTFHTEFERLFKISGKSDFLKYKTLGAIYQYVRTNENELIEIIGKNGLDSVIIYEVDSTYSLEMQYFNFNSMVVILDSDFNVAFIDHQNLTRDIFELDNDVIKKTLLDDVNTRFSELMFSLNYLDKRTRGEIRNMMTRKEKKEKQMATEETESSEPDESVEIIDKDLNVSEEEKSPAETEEGTIDVSPADNHIKTDEPEEPVMEKDTDKKDKEVHGDNGSDEETARKDQAPAPDSEDDSGQGEELD